MELPALFVKHKRLGKPRKVGELLPASLKQGGSPVGFVEFVGDLPYNTVRTNLAVQGLTDYGNLSITEGDTNLLVLSVSEAIKFYMPETALFGYIRFVMNNLHHTHYRQKLERRIYDIKAQFSLPDADGLPDPREALEEPERFPDGRPRQAIVRDKTLLSQTARESDLLLTLAIFHEALASYVEEVGFYIEHNEALSPSERTIAHSVLNSRFQEFAEGFFIYPTLGNITAEEMRKIKEEANTDTLSAEQKKLAIPAGWGRFYRAHMLATEIHKAEAPEEIIGAPEETITVRCPAFRFFGSVKKEKMLEEILEHVMSHPELQPLGTHASVMAIQALGSRYQDDEHVPNPELRRYVDRYWSNV